ncbi:MAG: methyltetrahydrofolate cobalamin methyltransferase [Desulfobacteraceae bacterium]|nr:methyltetrahydrofolate cobalamin methyltransferase [Desulfobacteraceae bacterium]
MIIVGELINASRKGVAESIESRDSEYIQKVAIDQKSAGANYIDVNAGIFENKEADYIKWLIENVQEKVGVPCCIDSPDPKVIEAGLSVHRGTAMVNSISLEKDRLEGLLPVISGTNIKIVALCTSDGGMPRTVEDRLKAAYELINLLVKKNIKLENIYVDPLVQPLATDTSFGYAFLLTIEKIMTQFKGIHTICGLSNISFGLPERKFLNRTFVVMAIALGLDAAIIDPLDKHMMANIIAAETLAGRDDFCTNYIHAYRENAFLL